MMSDKINRLMQQTCPNTMASLKIVKHDKEGMDNDDSSLEGDDATAAITLANSSGSFSTGEEYLDGTISDDSFKVIVSGKINKVLFIEAHALCLLAISKECQLQHNIKSCLEEQAQDLMHSSGDLISFINSDSDCGSNSEETSYIYFLASLFQRRSALIREQSLSLSEWVESSILCELVSALARLSVHFLEAGKKLYRSSEEWEEDVDVRVIDFLAKEYATRAAIYDEINDKLDPHEENILSYIVVYMSKLCRECIDILLSSKGFEIVSSAIDECEEKNDAASTLFKQLLDDEAILNEANQENISIGTKRPTVKNRVTHSEPINCDSSYTSDDVKSNEEARSDEGDSVVSDFDETEGYTMIA